MKTIFSTLIAGILIMPVVSAQNKSIHSMGTREGISIGVVTPPVQLTGNTNFLLSLNETDFNKKMYAFYTDSNATIAHININGSEIRLTGGANAEHIMAYTGKGNTVTLSFDKKATEAIANNSDGKNIEIQTTFVIYTPAGTIDKTVPAISIGNPFRHNNQGKN